MKPKDRPTLKLLIVLCLVLMAFYVGLKCSRGALKYPEPFKIRSIGETQQQLRDVGYNIKVDYIWGPNTDAAYCQWKYDESTKGKAQ